MEKEEFVEKEIINFENQMDPECVAQSKSENKVSKIVGIKFESKQVPKTFEGREYSYFTTLDLKEGDIVECITKFGPSIGMVTTINIPEEKIEKIREYMKNISVKYNKEAYLKGKIVVEEVAK